MDFRHVRTEDLRRLVGAESWPAIVAKSHLVLDFAALEISFNVFKFYLVSLYYESPPTPPHPVLGGRGTGWGGMGLFIIEQNQIKH